MNKGLRPGKGESIMLRILILILIPLLSLGCYDDIHVDLSSLSKEERTDFGSSRAVSRYAYWLVTLGPPDEVNGRYPQGRYGLWQQMPHEEENEWEWQGKKFIFKPVIDISCTPTRSEHPPGDLNIKRLEICDMGEEFCVEFEIDGLDIYQRRTAYRIDLLLQKGGRWYFLWGGCPIMDWGGHRAFWGVGWINKKDVSRLMGKKKKGIMLLEIRDFLTGGRRQAVGLWEFSSEERR